MNNDSSNKGIEELDDATRREVIDLVVERLRTMPANASLSIGGKGDFSVEELVDDVRAVNDIGLSVIKTQLDYLRSLKDLPIDDPADV